MFLLMRKLLFKLTKPEDVYFYHDEYWVDVSWQKDILERVFCTKYNHPYTYRKVSFNWFGKCKLEDTWINVENELEKTNELH